MSYAHCLGFPRIGTQRENKWAVEKYWRGESSLVDLEETGQRLRASNWQQQIESGLDFVTVGDFSWYDHVLDTSTLLGVVPERFKEEQSEHALDNYFRMARGRAPSGKDAKACEMTKWFDTNYHYIVPEFVNGQEFKVDASSLLKHVGEAKKLTDKVKVVVLGPLSYLWLGKEKGSEFDKLALLDKLAVAYQQLLLELEQAGVEWVQIDEPILVLDLPQTWQSAFEKVYNQLQFKKLQLLLTTYFGAMQENTSLACELPVAGLHIDLCRGEDQLQSVIDKLPAYKVLSVGVVDGRNIWRNDLEKWLDTLFKAKQHLGEHLWIGSSCSLLHSPVDLDLEKKLETEVKSWFAFAKQKLDEIVTLNKGLTLGKMAVAQELDEAKKAKISRQHSGRIHNDSVKSRVNSDVVINPNRQSPYEERAKAQQSLLKLPLFPTTTIGSFPQTPDIRKVRRAFKNNEISWSDYQSRMQSEIKFVIEKQEAIGLDVLVHGEPERNDMVEYFGELLNGITFTEHAWVQSYGSRCVKPPIIFGDVSRAKPMTVSWSQYAQANTDKWMKAMLTGPVTILSWSFVRDDQPRSQTALQIALALRDEVQDLEKAGINIIQVDEPAFREGLPLRGSDWQSYLDWAVCAFKVATSGVKDSTQIHTHMCYCEFNDIIKSIADLDADVITIESSRSQMELLEAFENFEYPNEIGPGVYDIHSPVVPSQEQIVELLQAALKYVPSTRLWVNPDCGLKTRDWPELEQALGNMVEAAKVMRAEVNAVSEAS